MNRARGLLKRLALPTAVALGVDRVLQRLRARQGAVLILNLHRVSPEKNPYWPPLHPALFDQLLGFLARRCTFTTFGRLRADSETDGARPLAVLSFDDGYEDFARHADPIMERHGLTANLNVVPSCVESGSPPRNVQLYDQLAVAPDASLAALASRLGVEGETGSPEGRQRVAAAISREFKLRPPGQLDAIWDEIQSELGDLEVTSPTRMLGRDALLRLGDRHELGAHSYGHDSMEFVSEEYFLEDVQRCSDFFEDRLGRPLRIYAFPNGSYREEQFDLLRQSGVEHMLLVGDRPSRPDADVHTRLMITGTTLPELRLQALGYRSAFRR